MSQRTTNQPRRKGGHFGIDHMHELNNSRCQLFTWAQRETWLKQRGFCVKCGKVKTHDYHIWGWYSRTSPGKVYKGHCLKCNKIEDVKIKLGERIEASDMGFGLVKSTNGNRRQRRRIQGRVSQLVGMVAGLGQRSSAAPCDPDPNLNLNNSAPQTVREYGSTIPQRGLPRSGSHVRSCSEDNIISGRYIRCREESESYDDDDDTSSVVAVCRGSIERSNATRSMSFPPSRASSGTGADGSREVVGETNPILQERFDVENASVICVSEDTDDLFLNDVCSVVALMSGVMGRLPGEDASLLMNVEDECESSTAVSLSEPYDNYGVTDRPTHDIPVFAVVPKAVKPGQRFALRLGSVHVLVVCPEDAECGQQFPLNIPDDPLFHPRGNDDAYVDTMEAGWKRLIRVEDRKFQWVLFDDCGTVDAHSTEEAFDVEKSAFVRRFDLDKDTRDDRFHRMLGGRISLASPEEVALSLEVKLATRGEPSSSSNNSLDNDNSLDNVLLTYLDILNVNTKSYIEKIELFRDACRVLCLDPDAAYGVPHIVRISVRRERMVSQSAITIMSMTQTELQSPWSISIVGDNDEEEETNADEVPLEWFQLVLDELCNPNFGLWQMTPCGCMDINPASGICCTEDHLLYFRFFGRVFGKVISEGHQVTFRMADYIYKLLLGCPLTFADLAECDKELHCTAMGLEDLGSDIEDVNADFTVFEDILGTVELAKGGEDRHVTQENMAEYMEACLKYRVFGRCESQLTELLLGVFEIIPESLWAIFDSSRELDLLVLDLLAFNPWRNVNVSPQI